MAKVPGSADGSDFYLRDKMSCAGSPLEGTKNPKQIDDGYSLKIPTEGKHNLGPSLSKDVNLYVQEWRQYNKALLDGLHNLLIF